MRMMARRSAKQLLVMLLAVFLTAGFSLAGAQASVMSAQMMTTTSDKAMVMHSDADTAMSSDMAGDRKACPKGAGDKGDPMHCPPTCIAPVLAVLPQGIAMRIVARMQEPLALPTPLLHGRSSLPDPYPPRQAI